MLTVEQPPPIASPFILDFALHAVSNKKGLGFAPFVVVSLCALQLRVQALVVSRPESRLLDGDVGHYKQ